MGLLIVALVALPAGWSDQGSELADRRRQIQTWKETDPERYHRLLRHEALFQSLSPEQQAKIRRFDEQFQAEPPEVRDRLLHVLGEYVSWLTRLPEADRERILQISDTSQRLQVIREIKERQWIESQPPTRLSQWQKTPPAERSALVARWRQEDKQRAEELAETRRWEALGRVVRPFENLPPLEELTVFVTQHLLPMLSPEEKARLRPKEPEARRNPMSWFATIVELSDRHPVLSLKPQYLTRKELPAEYRDVLEKPPKTIPPQQVRSALARLPAEGKWPDFPVAVSRLVQSWVGPRSVQLGPSRAQEISPAVVRFVERLSPEDQKRLQAVEGRWPDYPLMLHEIARERKLALPDLGLPGDPLFWDRVRNRRVNNTPPDPPDHLLREFAAELARREPETPRLSLRDPEQRELLKKRFLDAYPEWWRHNPTRSGPANRK
jgi:hypothetical protein